MAGHVKVHVMIEGRVQGVSYRAWTIEQARMLGIDGWVRNRTDGRVEAVFSGFKIVVEEMITRCRKGPILAQIERLEVQDWDENVEQGFHRYPTL